MKAAAFFVSLTIAAVAVLFACSSDDNPTPTVTPGADAQPPNADASTCIEGNCNTCTTPSEDPYNACSAAAGGCVPFDNDTRVPRGPDGQIPKVP
jgi:hypothetical protein